jgi:hypothetical protein
MPAVMRPGPPVIDVLRNHDGSKSTVLFSMAWGCCIRQNALYKSAVGLPLMHSLTIACLIYTLTPSMSVPIPTFASIRASPDSFENSGGIVTAEWRVHFPHKEQYFVGVYLDSEDVLNTAPIK